MNRKTINYKVNNGKYHRINLKYPVSNNINRIRFSMGDHDTSATFSIESENFMN